MAISTRVIKTKIKAVSNIQKITKAMEMVAASKMKKTVNNALGTRTYAKLASELVANLSKDKYLKHPFFKKNNKEKYLIVYFASNKGLCGSFNVLIEKEINKFFKNQPDISFITIGKKAEIGVNRIKKPIVASFSEFSDNPKIEEITGLMKIIKDEFISGKYRKVYIVYTYFHSPLKQEVKIKEILPITPEIIAEANQEYQEGEIKNMSLYLFEPDEDKVLEEILPRLTEVNIYQSFLESLASEQSARMVAMKNATENAGNLVEDLVLVHNTVRQANVTQQIAEIASGSDSLNS